jgi:hypothetical protein
LYEKFDDFYARQDPVEFERCEKGYIREVEGWGEVRPYAFDEGA